MQIKNLTRYDLKVMDGYSTKEIFYSEGELRVESSTNEREICGIPCTVRNHKIIPQELLEEILSDQKSMFVVEEFTKEVLMQQYPSCKDNLVSCNYWRDYEDEEYERRFSFFIK